LQLLWRGIAAYVWQHGIELMFGCASLPGTDADAIAAPLSYLRAHHSAPPELLVRARPERRIEMDRAPAAALDAKSAFSALPPLVKGYLRVGAHVGDGAALDAEFGTIDVCVVLPTDRVTKRYLRHYERAAPPLDGGPDTRLD
jgi:putative hemolysin